MAIIVLLCFFLADISMSIPVSASIYDICSITFFLKKFYLFYLFLFLAVLGLRCCVWAFSSCGEWGLLFVAVRRLLIAVASLVAEQGL